MLGVLDLFSEREPAWSPDAIAARLGCSLPTAYRYVRALAAAGLVRKAAAGRYVLGPRLAALDFQMQQTEPLFGAPALRALGDDLGCDVMVAEAIGEAIVTVHLRPGREGVMLSYGRGRHLPPFRGALSKVVLAGMSRPALRRFHAAHGADAADDPFARSFERLVANLKAIRRAGYARSVGEIDAGLVALAVPLVRPDGGGTAALGIAGSAERLADHEREGLVAALQAAADAAVTTLAVERESPPDLPAVDRLRE